MNKLLSIIIVTYNNEASIGKCLDSIHKQDHGNFQLIIVDNNSTDGTLKSLNSFIFHSASFKKKTVVIQRNNNEGFAKGVNTGLRIALKNKKTYACLLLNPDVYMKNNLFTEGLKELDENKNVGATGPVILYPDNTVWWIGTHIYSNYELLTKPVFSISEHLYKRKKISAYTSQKFHTDAITGCSMFIRRSALERIGLLDEQYFMYAEDVDYSVRLKQAGYTLSIFNSSIVYHEVPDKDMSAARIIKNLQKYKIYLTSITRYLVAHKPFPLVLFWMIKLPYVFAYQYYKRSIS